MSAIFYSIDEYRDNAFIKMSNAIDVLAKLTHIHVCMYPKNFYHDASSELVPLMLAIGAILCPNHCGQLCNIT